MSQFYFNPEREAHPYALPDAEVFYAESGELGTDDDGDPFPAGWYYWACFPGCLPDSEPYGPFETEEEAIADAQESNDEIEDSDDEKLVTVEIERAAHYPKTSDTEE